MVATAETSAFPKLTEEETELLAQISSCQEFADGEYVYKAGQRDVDFFVVKSGGIEVQNPAMGNASVVTHGPGQFSGDIDVLTGRPCLVHGVARGVTKVWRVPNASLREVLIRIPHISDKLLVAFQMRREMLQDAGKLGLQVIGYAHCHDTTAIREFLHRNFVPFDWNDVDDPDASPEVCNLSYIDGYPRVRFADQPDLIRPTLREVAAAAGLWRQCPDRTVDVAIVGAGPGGLAAAVYAASEGLSTLVIDSLGPGGQAGGSSKIENFIGFPSGLSGRQLAERGVLQMLKFGASMVAPVKVEKLVPPSADNPYHSLYLDCGTVVQSRVVLVACGVKWRKLEAKNAQRYERQGVYYTCTSIEAFLHDKEDVAVVGAGNSAGQAAMYLAECCPSRMVHIIARGKLGPSMSEYLHQRMLSTPNITVHENAQVTEVHGNFRIQNIVVKNKDGERTMDAGAVFVFIGSEPATDWLPPEVARDEKGFVLTGVQMLRANKWTLADRDPCELETSVPGILAAGDVRSGSTKRVGFAVGDGALAVSCFHTLLSMSEEYAATSAGARAK